MASKAERAAYAREWRKKNPEKQRGINKRYKEKKGADWRKRNQEKVKLHYKRAWLKRYGLTVDGYDALVVNGCFLCGRKKSRLCVDHDHDTGRVRGILCYRCNIMMGHYERIRRLDLWEVIEEYLDDAR